MTLGADIGSLTRAGNRFSDGASRLTRAGSPLHASAGGLSSRFAGSRNEIDHAVRLLQSHAANLHALAHSLHKEASDQQRVSGDRSNLGSASSLGARGLAPVGVGAAGALPLLRGMPRRVKPLVGTVPILRGTPRLGKRSGMLPTYNKAIADWANRSRLQAEAGRSAIESSQSLIRSFQKAPHGPRTISGLFRIKPNEILQRFATKSVSATTKAKYLKSSKGAGGSLLASLAVLALTRGDKETVVKTFGEGLDQGLSVVGAIAQARKLQGLTQLTRPISIAAKVGGGFAILGGVIGLVDTANRYKAGKISGGRAAGEGLTNAAMIAGGVMMFTPAAPIGAAIIAGAAVVQAGLWIYDNRQKVAGYAQTAARVVTKAQTAAVRAVATQVTRVVPAPVKQMAVQLASGAKKTLSKLFGRK